MSRAAFYLYVYDVARFNLHAFAPDFAVLADLVAGICGHSPVGVVDRCIFQAGGVFGEAGREGRVPGYLKRAEFLAVLGVPAVEDLAGGARVIGRNYFIAGADRGDFNHLAVNHKRDTVGVLARDQDGIIVPVGPAPVILRLPIIQQIDNSAGGEFFRGFVRTVPGRYLCLYSCRTTNSQQNRRYSPGNSNWRLCRLHSSVLQYRRQCRCPTGLHCPGCGSI